MSAGKFAPSCASDQALQRRCTEKTTMPRMTRIVMIMVNQSITPKPAIAEP
jgi:hypothetical protein